MASHIVYWLVFGLFILIFIDGMISIFYHVMWYHKLARWIKNKL